MKWSHKAALAASAITLVSGGAAGTALAATAVTPAAVGTAFNASGTWALGQSNGTTTTVTLTQDPAGNLSGNATAETSGISGTVGSGSQVDGTYIIFTINWSNGSVGQHTAALQSDRTLYGTTLALTNVASHATWYTYKTF